MSLLADAEDAQDIGAAFSKFLDALPDQAVDVTGLIAELYNISAALRELDATIHSRQYGHRSSIIKEDLDLVCESLSYTLKDAFDILGEIRTVGDTPTVGAYRQTWKDLCYHFQRESRGSLRMRLERYRRFIGELNNTMKRAPPNQGVYGDLRDRIEDLVEVQESSPERLASDAANLSLGPQAGPRVRRSWTRVRPPGPASPLSPQSPGIESIPPYAPEPPLSPTVSHSTAASISTSNSGDHWATRIFSEDVGATALPRSGDASKCYGTEVPDAKVKLSEEYDQVAQIRFGGGSGLIVKFYHRDHDRRARILCRSSRSSGPSKYSCLPLNSLIIRRPESSSSLQLCRRTGSGLDLWANMKFTTIENMVLFFCLFLALRSQDCGKPVLDIKDNELTGETEVYGGQIMDDNFLHALRVFRDKSSKAIRLQASVLRGEMKGTPVWTAFIHHQIASRSWLKRPGSKIVHLADLRRFTFSDEYTPQRTGRGESVLNFTSSADAEGFVDTIDDLSDACRR